MTTIVLCHSFTLLMEMLVIHVALTSSFKNLCTYIISDCFKELMVSVMKKCDHKFLLMVALDDSVERWQVSLYVCASLLQTQRSFDQIFWNIVTMWFGECLVDYLKHYFLIQ